ncbi:MAG: hypothetical protein AAGG81_07210, partial [Chlamydiota bacterium]
FSGKIYFLTDGLRSMFWEDKFSYGQVRNCSQEPIEFSGPVQKSKELEYLKVEIKRIGMNLQQNLKSTDDFFEKNFFANQ